MHDSPARVPSLTSLRFFAAFLVFAFHATAADPVLANGQAAHALKWIFGGGASGVSFFFVLSGFVLTWTSSAHDTPSRFWRRRAAKVFPNHLVTWAVVLIGGAALHKQVTALAAAASGLLVQAWVPNRSVYFAVNTPSWSLSCEMFFYLLFPFLIGPMRRMTVRNLRFVAVSLGLAPAVLALASPLLPPALAYWMLFVFPPVRLIEFAFGVSLALLVLADAVPRIPLISAVITASAAVVLAGHVPWQWGFSAVVIVPVGALLCSATMADRSGRRVPLLHSTWLLRLGEASFAFYLVHEIVLRFAGIHTASLAVGAGALLGVFGVSLGLALAQYRWWETPLNRRLSGGRSRASAPRVGVPVAD